MSSPANNVPAPLVALAGWLVPGAGYWLIGQRSRALISGITILILFILGCLIGGMKVIDPASSYSNLFRAIMQKPWFVAQILAGPITLISALIAKGPQFVVSHVRVNEIGTLYTAVAGMLNLLVIIDCSHRAWREGSKP
jgi:hypothetical protein